MEIWSRTEPNDGHHHGSVTYMQELPKYTDDLVNWVRRSKENISDEEKKALLKAIRKVKGQADGLRPDTTAYNHFRTSLYELLEKVDEGNKKSIERAIQTAVEEKSRYVAENCPDGSGQGPLRCIHSPLRRR